MSGLTSLSKHTEINALIAFVDLSRYMKTSVQMENSKVAMWRSTASTKEWLKA